MEIWLPQETWKEEKQNEAEKTGTDKPLQETSLVKIHALA
jgi:hypothetical protein